MDNCKKKKARLKRLRKVRARIKDVRNTRLSVHKTVQHIYVQLVAHDGSKILASASTNEKDIKSGLKSTSNIEAAKKVGDLIAKRAKAAGVTKVAFDRAGFKYHGRVKALADAAREGGLEF